MKKVTGFIDDFRRANIMEKMPKTYFFDQDDRPDKIAKYIRKRHEPEAPEVAEIKKPDIPTANAFADNYLIDKAITFDHQRQCIQLYDERKKRGHDRIA